MVCQIAETLTSKEVDSLIAELQMISESLYEKEEEAPIPLNELLHQNGLPSFPSIYSK